MTAELVFEKVKPTDPPRDGKGRPLIKDPETGQLTAYTRCTTFVAALDDRTALEDWKTRLVAQGLTGSDELLDLARRIGPETPETRPLWQLVASKALDLAGGHKKAERGTQLHTLTEEFDLGRLHTGSGRELDPWLAEYARITEPLTPVLTEQFLVTDELRIGGTADRVVRVAGHEGLFIADLKTGRVDVALGKIAMQLAVYSHSQLYDPETGARTPVEGLRTDLGLVIHLPATGGPGEVFWVDLEAGWQAVQLAAQVRAWRRENKRVKINFGENGE